MFVIIVIILVIAFIIIHYHSLSLLLFIIVHFLSFIIIRHHLVLFGIIYFLSLLFVIICYHSFFLLLLIIIHYCSSYHVRYHSLSPVIVSGMTLTLTMPLTADCCNPVCLCLFLSGAHVSALLSLKIGLSAADTRSIRRSVEENRHGDVSTNYSPPFFSKVKVKWIDNKMNQMGL